MTMSAGEGPSNGRPHAPDIEDNQNAKRCRNWICACASKMAAKRETMMSAVTTPPEIILYYRLNHSIWSLSDNRVASR
jgi:hypothetical protein